MKPCKLLIMTDTYVGLPGGSERHLLNFLTNISDEFQVQVIQLNPDGNPYSDQLDKSLTDKVDFKSYPITSLKSIHSFFAILKIYFSILLFRPNLVISYHEKSDLINLLLSLCPFTSHKLVSSKRDMGLKLDGTLGDIMRRFNGRFSAITAPSNSIINMMVKKFNSKKEQSYAIPNGVDLTSYGKNLEKSDEIKLKLGLPLNKTILVSVGWLREGKGHEYVIRAMAAMSEKDRYSFVVLGEGPDKDRLLKLAIELGVEDNLFLVGMQKNVGEWLSVSDIAISASFSEGLSNALVEAAASELPIIATNVGGNPEVVEHGHNGILVEPREHLAIKQAIESICEEKDLLLNMGVNSRQKAEKEFSISNMVNRLETLYMTLSGVNDA